MKYKKSFRKIISSEINKNKRLKNYYDGWGSRNYVFVNDIGTNLLKKKDNKSYINININTNAFHLLGGTYIFSAYEIKNFEENKLIFLKKFTNIEAAWDIFLYKVI